MAKRQRRKRRQRRHEHATRTGWRTRHSVITGAGLAATATIGLTGSAQAAATYYYVGSTADTATAPADCTDPANTDCTLRHAINAANANDTFADSIYFSSTISGTPIVLTSDLPVIDDPVYIVGNGPGANTVSGDDSYRIFNIQGADGDRVVIAGLQLTDGYADDGGAIFNDNAELGLYDAFLTGNTASDQGGAIYLRGADSEEGANGTIAYTTISGNHADNVGGGVYGYESVGTIGTSTITGNSSGAGGGVSSYIPGFIYSSTITGNAADVGGGVYEHGGGINRTGYLYNSIVANNLVGTGDPDLHGDFYAGFDLVKTPATATLDTSDPRGFGGPNITGVDPQLETLGLNGGDTPNFRPASASPVVDQGQSFEGSDQRFSTRPIEIPSVPNAPGGDGGDIGSVELTLAEGPHPTPTPTAGLQPFNLKKALKHCKKKFPGKAKAQQRKKCIKKAKRRARASSVRSLHSASPWRSAAADWAKSEGGQPPAAHHAFSIRGH